MPKSLHKISPSSKDIRLLLGNVVQRIPRSIISSRNIDKTQCLPD
jgi:hypothetical protein